MTTMNTSPSDDKKAFVDEQARRHSYMSASEYVRALIRQQKDAANFRALIDDGINSGETGPAEEVLAEWRALIET
jgi:putative addiction module CopG family antidote